MSVVLAGLVLIAIEFLRSVPAWRTIRRNRSTDGLSAHSLGVLAGTGIPWIVLAVMVGSPWVLAANIIWITFHLLMCWDAARISPHLVPTIARSAALSGGILLASFAAASVFMTADTALGLVLGFSTLFYAVPALIAGLTSTTTRALSPTSLAVNTAEGIIYLLAGLTVIPMAADGDVLGFILLGAISGLSNGLRLIRVILRRYRSLDRLPEVELAAHQ